MHVQVGDLSQDSTFDLFEFLAKFFFQNLSFQTRGAAYLRVRLIRRCLWYMYRYMCVVGVAGFHKTSFN